MKKYDIYGKNTKKMGKNILITFSLCLTLFLAVLTSTSHNVTRAIEVAETDALQFNEGNVEGCLYLSDIDYIKNQTSVGWDQIRYNEVNGGGKITVKIENNAFSFDKGIWAHATSQITYDIGEYGYKYFTAFVGLNTTTSKGNGVKFTIYTSKDGSTWEPKVQELLKKPGENADFIKVDISDDKYLRLYANDNGANGNDHSVYADAKLVNEVSATSFSVAEYDKQIKSMYKNQNDITGDLELALLKRELISSVGEYTISILYNESAEKKAAIDWLMNTPEVLKDYIMGGKPEGSYYNSLTQLSRLYDEYALDFNNTELLNNKWEPNLTYGDLYKKMAISISLTHSQNVGLWMQSGRTENKSDALRRYAIFKYLHKNGRLRASDSLDFTPMFESLKIEEMRFIMNNAIDDEEIIWLNAYVKTKIKEEPKKAWLTPHPHIAYVWPNYQNSVYYDENNVSYFNELFAVNDTTISENKIGLFDLKYTIPGGKNVPSYTLSISRGTPNNKIYKVWMNFRNKFGTGAVCGGISKSGSNIRATHGIPATVIGQPGHAALLFYSKDTSGKGYWGIDNDVSGWSLSEKGERMLLGWGNNSYNKGSYQVVYMALAQEVLNDYETFEKSEKLVKLANTYTNDLKKQEEIYRKALAVQPLNIDAWYGLITVYNNSDNKTEDDYYNLANELADALKYYPLPMYQLTNLIKPKLTSIQNSYKFTLLQTRILTDASKLPNNSADNYYVYQPSVTRTEANYLLGKIDKTIATFSFDGEDSGKIVLSSRFDGNGIRWDYSLDGKNNWKEVSFTADEPHKLQLTADEIKSITAENDIYVHIVGVNYAEENLYKIDITEQQLPSTLYANDLENRVVGVGLTMEWRMNENDPWTSYATLSPDLTGNKTVQVRMGATATKLPSSYQTYTFTEDNQPDTRKYVPVSHLSIQSVSTEAVKNAGSASNAIDGNYNTRYHSAWNGTDTERYIIIKIDRVIDISAIEYVPAGGGNGKIIDGTIYGSMDGENFEVLTTVKDLKYVNNDDGVANTKAFEMPEHKEIQYIKIVADKATNGNWFSARMFNIYQDVTINPHPTAGIGYSETSLTNKDVVARLVNPSTDITITNNNGSDTYIFAENGTFTFEFKDNTNGRTGEATARVDWIDKTAPTATIGYSKNTATNEEVVATLKPNEDVTVLNNGVSSEENPNANPFTYTFSDNGTFTFEFKDKAGNVGKATAKVDWINRVVPNAVVTYDIKESTSKDVTATITFDKDDVIITNNGGKNTYTFTKNGTFTFEFKDSAGNTGTKLVTVNWIEENKQDETITPSTPDTPSTPEKPSTSTPATPSIPVKPNTPDTMKPSAPSTSTKPADSSTSNNSSNTDNNNSGSVNNSNNNTTNSGSINSNTGSNSNSNSSNNSSSSNRPSNNGTINNNSSEYTDNNSTNDNQNNKDNSTNNQNDLDKVVSGDVSSTTKKESKQDSNFKKIASIIGIALLMIIVIIIGAIRVVPEDKEV